MFEPRLKQRLKQRLKRGLRRVTLWPRFAYHFVRALMGLAHAVALCIALTPALVGCHSPRPAQAPIASTSSPARVAYDAARLALATLDAIEDARLAELERTGYTAAELAAAEIRSKRLQLAHAALTAAYEHLVAGDPRALRDAMRDAVGLLRQLADDPAVSPPEKVRQGIAMAAAWVGGDGGS